MDTSRQNSAEEQKNSRMTSNPANTYENSYHQKPPSFNHKQVNISLVDDGSNNTKKQQKTNKNEKQESGSNEWRESIPIKLEHFLFNFKENSLKVYKAPKIMLISAILACLLFCGVLALILSQRDDLKKEANLPLDQSAIAERIIGESLLSHHKLKNSLFEQKNQTGGERSKKNYHSAKLNDASAKDAAVRKAFGSLLFSGDDNDEIEPDPEENNSDESFDGERSRSRTNFNLFLSDNERQNTVDEQKEKSQAMNYKQNENPKVMFIERLMGFGMQPKFGLSESLVIRKTIGGDENISTSDDQTTSSNKIKESKIKSEEDPTFLLKYAAAAMLSRILATAQQQAYIQQVQQQQRFREMNEKNIFNNHPPYYRGYRMMRGEPAESALMYGRPMHQPHKPHYHPQSRLLPPFQTAPGQFVSSDRGFSRGPLLSNEEAETQNVHPIILMLNIPYKDQTPAAAHLMGQGQAAAFAQPTIETSMQPIFMPYAPNNPLPRQIQNPYYKPTRDQQHPVYSPPFSHHKNHNYYPQQSVNEGYHPYNSIPMNRGNANGPLSPHQQRYNHRMANTIEVPIEIHQVSSPILPSQSHHAVTHQPTAQIIVQPQLESVPQPNENDQDQSNENEHHMVVFYDSSDNMSHSEENNSNNIPQQQPPTFVKENKPSNNNLEKTNQQMAKMLLLHFVNPNNVAPPTMNQQPQIVDSMPPEQQSPQLRKPFLIQQEQPVIEKQQQPVNNQDNQNKQKPEIIKNEEETSSTNDQINREEVFEKTTVSDNQNESENEPASLAHFAQVIRHVIDQQHQNQEQRPPQQIQPIIAQQKPVSSVSQQSPQNQQTSTSPTIQQFNQRKDIQIENSNKEISQIEKSESIQESIQSPAFAMLVENDEN